MKPNKIKALWREGKPASVCWVGAADAYLVETLAHSGFDGIVLDMQHGMAIGVDRAAACLQAISTTDTVPLVRVPWNDPVHIQYMLDAGAYGVVVPLVGSYEEARKAGGACRYAPLGYRSVGPNRARLYGGGDYLQRANDEIICLVMIEDINTIPRLEEIADAPGIDGFYVGPTDMAMTIGPTLGEGLADPRHAEACQKVVETANRHGLVAGIHCASPAEALRRFSQGFRFSPIGSDVGFVVAAANAAVKTVREGLAG